WPDTGKLKVKAHYRAGQLHGLVEQYYPSGALQLKHPYAEHRLHGEALDYFENGQLKSSVHFEHGVQSGPFKLFSADGKLLEEGVLKEGVRHGPFTLYSPETGQPVRQGTYQLNELDGEVITWRPDGLKVVGTYEKGLAHGWQKIYNAQGALLGEIKMQNGRATGVFHVFDAKGRIVQEGSHGKTADELFRIITSPRPQTNDPTPEENGGIVIKEIFE
ncbi:MORN variant repeat protein, partial [gut metagenome]